MQLDRMMSKQGRSRRASQGRHFFTYPRSMAGRLICVNRSLLHSNVERRIVVAKAPNAALHVVSPCQFSVRSSVRHHVSLAVSRDDPISPYMWLVGHPLTLGWTGPKHPFELVSKGQEHALTLAIFFVFIQGKNIFSVLPGLAAPRKAPLRNRRCLQFHQWAAIGGVDSVDMLVIGAAIEHVFV